MKKIISFIMIICVINILFCGLVYADEQKFDGNNILDNTSVLKDYLDEESKHDLPNIEKSTQLKLNKLGLFNDEILQINPEFIHNIDNATVDEITVKTEYILYSEENNSIQSKKLSNEEIDKVIEKMVSLNQNALFSSDTVISESEYSFSAKSSSSSTNSLMKKSMIATTVYDGSDKKLSCVYVCSWLTEPSQRLNDVVTIGWGLGQGSFDYSESYYATYSYMGTTVWYTQNPNSNTYTKHTSTEGYELDLSSNMRNTASENGLNCKSSLRDDSEDIIGTTIYYNTYTNHTFSMGFYLTNISDTSYTYLKGQYFHQNQTGGFNINNISVGFNVLSGTASISISGGYETNTYYNQIGDTALLNHRY